MIDRSLYISLKNTDADPEVKGLTWSKEVIYVGNFEAPQADGSSIKFSVSKEDLQNWKESIDAQIKNGIRVDVPISHTTNPEASRGKVIAAEVKPDSKERQSLWVTIEFADAKAARLAKTTDVSLYSPPSWKDGLGNVYSRPIRHVALTQQPVIADLDAFTLIASLDESSQPMDSLLQIADAIGLEPVDGEDEAALTQRILDAINAEEAPEDEEMPMDDEAPLDDEVPMDEEAPPEDGEDFSLSHEVLAGRRARVELLLSQGRINPAQRRSLESRFCVKKGLKLSNEFDSAIATLSLSEPRKAGSRTGAQLPRDTALSPLLADAERRAKVGGH